MDSNTHKSVAKLRTHLYSGRGLTFNRGTSTNNYFAEATASIHVTVFYNQWINLREVL